jgi:hypothetical protein
VRRAESLSEGYEGDDSEPWAIPASHRQNPEIGEHRPRLGLSDERSRGDGDADLVDSRGRRFRTSSQTES